mgnify:CR=1 FL=1
MANKAEHPFIRKGRDFSDYVDGAFGAVAACMKDRELYPDLTVNATAGTFFGSDGRIAAFKTVYDVYDSMDPRIKASYASNIAGNAEFRGEVFSWINRRGNILIPHDVIATAGGTGAIYTAVKTCLSDGDTILYPQIAWGNYKVIADEYNLKPLTYDIYDLNDLLDKIDAVEGKVFLIVNSPCENPLGCCLSYEEWRKIVDKLNHLGREAVLLCDIAYIDYANNDPKKFFELFNDLSDDVLVLIAASCSKAFSYYGQRLGALIAIHNDPEFLDHYINLCSRLARATWSNLHNGAMINIAQVLKDHREEYLKELKEAREMLGERTRLFIRQAQECGLELYTSSDGFFVTLKMEDNEKRDAYHEKLIEKHIYTIKVNKGIRVGLCSTPIKVVDGLAYQLKELM